jgi:hypothetical protein
MAAVLHGLNDWSVVNSHPVWILVVLASGVLFLGYARVGARDDVQFPEGLRQAAERQPAAAPAPRPLAVPAGHRPGIVSGGGGRRPWWEH